MLMKETRHCGFRTRVLAGLLMLMMVFSFAMPAITGANINPFVPDVAYAGGTGGTGDIFDSYIDPNSGGVNTTQNPNATDLKGVLSQYRTIATVITGILTVTMLIFMLFQFTKLGAAGDNEMARKRAIMGILTTGIATALLGGATIVIGFFWNILANTQTQTGGGGGTP